jgi:anti-anti-sigma regulatory factor
MLKKSKIEKKRFNTSLGLRRYRKSIKRKPYKYGRYKNLVKINGSSYHDLKAPRVLTIYSISEEFLPDEASEYKMTLDFINSLSSSLVKGRVIVNFEETESINAAALLLLYATIHSIQQSSKFDSRVRLSKSPIVNKLIKASNLKRLIERRELITPCSQIKRLPVVTSNDAKYIDDIIDYIKVRIYDNGLDANDESVLSDAIQESIENVLLHAYPEGESKLHKQWWLLCDVIGDQLFLAIHDRGVSIPNTVKHREWFERAFQEEYPELYDEIKDSLTPSQRFLEYLNIKPNITDKHLINVSMTGDYSSIKTEGRGQGSKSIKYLVNENESGKLWIFSRLGLFVYNSEEDSRLVDLPIEIPGTLIQWNIKIK